MKRLAAVTLCVLLAPAAVQAQHDHAHSPYAGAEIDSQATILAEEAAQLRNGEGMGLALVAELNRYPGPTHVIELAEPLGLDRQQLTAVKAIREAMTAAAIAKGEEVLTMEARLTEWFRSGEITPEVLRELTTSIGRLRGELRAIHLAAHLETRRLMSEEQIEDYDRHRGYGGP